MSGDLVLAVVGVSAGAGSAVGAWAALWWRDRVPHGQEWLIRHIYPYIDDRIGATKKENQTRAGKRFRVIHKRRWYWWLVPNSKKLPIRQSLANYFYPVPQIGTGTSPLPGTKRMARYVALELIDPAPRRLHLDAVVAVRLYPTSEVSAMADQFARSLLPWVAWALRVPPNQLVIDPDPVETLTKYGYVRYALKQPAPEVPMTMPVGVNADA